MKMVQLVMINTNTVLNNHESEVDTSKVVIS